MSIDIKPLAYNSLWQLRNDTWSSLEESTTQLALAGAQQRSVEQLAETVTGSDSGRFPALRPTERCGGSSPPVSTTGSPPW